MKTAPVAELRNNFRRISSWIGHGETVQIIKRGRAFVCLTGVRAVESVAPVPKPDIMAPAQGSLGRPGFFHGRGAGDEGSRTGGGPGMIAFLDTSFLTIDGNQKKLAQAEGPVVAA